MQNMLRNALWTWGTYWEPIRKLEGTPWEHIGKQGKMEKKSFRPPKLKKNKSKAPWAFPLAEILLCVRFRRTCRDSPVLATVTASQPLSRAQHAHDLQGLSRAQPARAGHRHSQSAPLPCPARTRPAGTLPCPARRCWPPSQPVIHYVRAQHGPETRAPSGTDGRSEFIYKMGCTLKLSKWQLTTYQM